MNRDHADDPAFSHWYVAQLKPGGLDAARRNLDRQGFVTFMPFLAAKQGLQRKGRQSKPAPMFLGYLFVQLSQDRKNWRAINSTLGVSRLLLSNASRPATLPIGFVEALRERCDSSGLFRSAGTLRPGDEVRLVSGPFSGLIGEVEALPQAGRARVLLEILGRAVRSDVPTDHLDIVPLKPSAGD